MLSKRLDMLVFFVFLLFVTGLYAQVTNSPHITPQVQMVVFSDDFNDTIIDDTMWHIPTWVSPTDGTYIGRTQFECSQNAPLPASADSNAEITLQTYNPTGASFYGYDMISNQVFTTNCKVTIFARLGAETPGGTVSGLFLYDVRPENSNLHDEIDFEIISNDLSTFMTNVYGNDLLGVGHPMTHPYPSGSATDLHIYTIQWYPDSVTWSVDNIIVRTITSAELSIPQGSMHLHLNMWVPDSSFATAYNASLNYTTDLAANQVFTTYVDEVIVQQVVVPTLTAINISPATFSMNIGDTQMLMATPTDQSGNLFPTTLVWASDNPDVVTVDPSTGLITAISVGVANVTASSGVINSNEALITVVVNNPGIQFLTVPRYGKRGRAKGICTDMEDFSAENFRVLIFIRVAGGWWTKPTFADPASKIKSKGKWSGKIVTGGHDARATEIRAYVVPVGFTATCHGESTLPDILAPYPFADIIRLPAPTGLRKISVIQSPVFLNAGGEPIPFTATGLDKNKQPIATTFFWLSTHPDIARVNQAGVVTPITYGSAIICAISGNRIGKTKVKVQ